MRRKLSSYLEDALHLLCREITPLLKHLRESIVERSALENENKQGDKLCTLVGDLNSVMVLVVLHMIAYCAAGTELRDLPYNNFLSFLG